MENNFNTWLEIDLSGIKYNLSLMKKIIGPSTKLCYVVKANCYGYGVEEIVKYCKDEKCIDMFGVATLEEGIKLRNIGVKKPVLVFKNPFKYEIDGFYQYGLEMTLTDFDTIEEIEKKKKIISAHIMIDTGLGHLGFVEKDIPRVIEKIKKVRFINIKGIYSHFSISFTKDKETIYHEFNIFLNTLKMFYNSGLKIDCRHIASSNAAIYFPESRLDMVRVGGAIYNQIEKRFKPVVALKSRVALVKKIEKNKKIGYGGNYTVKNGEKIVIVNAGHADGIIPFLSNGVGEVIINGKKWQIAGRISMDMVAVPVSEKEKVSKGDVVTFIGKDRDQEIKLRDVFEKLGHWNILGNSICRRVVRIYKANKKY